MIPSRLASLALIGAAAIPAQVPESTLGGMDRASHLIIPQRRAFHIQPGSAAVTVTAVHAQIRILEMTARTAMRIELHNPGSRPAEAVLLMPVPEGAAISAFAFDGPSPGPTARLLGREEARRTYDSIVARLRDPALLEFAGYNLIRSSVFPIAAGGRQRIDVAYEHVLDADGSRVDYVLPRSESLQPNAPWSIQVDIESQSHEIATVYSPSHQIAVQRPSPRRASLSVSSAQAREPGPFLLSYLMDAGDKVTASLFAYPDATVGGGYFLLLAGLPSTAAAHRDGIRREVTLVLDRSGSMAGEKMDQALAAARQVVEGLEDGESFNIIDYSTTVARFAAEPVVKTRSTIEQVREYLASLRPGGGTNIHDALLAALSPEPQPGTLPIVLFLTDGLPTVGKTHERLIRDAIQAANVHHRRIFTFGLGNDVNVPLLDWVADQSRAITTYVQPKEDVEVKVAQVFAKLYGPVLADAELLTVGPDGKPDTRRIREQQPGRLPDLFENDRLVVLGQYRGTAPLRFRLRGSYHGKSREVAFQFAVDKPNPKNAFVPRLWATRQIAHLIDQIRQAGAAQTSTAWASHSNPLADPAMQEIRDEILRLSTKFGILSEYTAFLATEGTQLSDWNSIVMACTNELEGKAVRTRSGIGAVNQGANILTGKSRAWSNRRNEYLNSQMERVEISSVQQIHDCAFFRRGKRWVDSRAILDGKLDADRTVRFGSPEHLALVRSLVRAKRAGVLSLSGEILLRLDGRNVLVVNEGP